MAAVVTGRTSSSTDDPVTVAQFAAFLGRHWRLLAIAVAIGLGVGAAAWAWVPPRYSATALVDVTPPADAAVTSTTITAATERDVMLSQPVARRAAAALEAQHYAITPSELHAGLSVTVSNDSEVVAISYRAAAAHGVADVANAVAEAYLGRRENLSRQRLAAREKDVRTQLDAALAMINDLPLRDGVQRHFAQSDATRLTAQLSRLESTAVDTGQLIAPAKPPSSGTRSRVAVYLVGGALVGLLIGTPLVGYAERVRRSRTPV